MNSLRLHLLSSITRLWPFANGSGRLIDRFGERLWLGNGIRRCYTSDGFALSVLEDDHIGRHIIISKQFDRSPINQLLRFAKAGDVVLDVGANIGYVTGIVLSVVPDCTVVAVEPQPRIRELLRTNMAQFADRVTIVESAVSDSSGTARLRIDTANRGATHLTDDEAGSVEVPLMSADELLRGFDKLDLIKIDIEGYEQRFFRSGLDQIRRLGPRAILFEDKENRDGSAGSVLAGLGYTIYSVRKQLFRTELIPIGIATDDNDFLAVREHASG